MAALLLALLALSGCAGAHCLDPERIFVGCTAENADSSYAFDLRKDAAGWRLTAAYTAADRIEFTGRPVSESDAQAVLALVKQLDLVQAVKAYTPLPNDWEVLDAPIYDVTLELPGGERVSAPMEPDPALTALLRRLAVQYEKQGE